MCDSCFNIEHRTFSSAEEYHAFDLELTKKIANEKSMRLGQNVNTGWKDVGYQVYECLICGQLWKLSNLDNPGAPQFLRTTKINLQRDITPFYKSKGFLGTFIVCIAIAILLFVLRNR